MKKSELRKLIREEIQKIYETKNIKGKNAGNYIKLAPKGRKITIKNKNYICLGKGKWKGPKGEKLDWIEISSMASALGNKIIQYEFFNKITKKKLRKLIKEELKESYSPNTSMMQDYVSMYFNDREGQALYWLTDNMNDRTFKAIENLILTEFDPEWKGNK